jgi:hypothetical protein
MCVKITLKFEAWKKSKWPSSLNLISFVHIWLDLKCEEQAKDDEMKKCKSCHDIQCLLVKTQFFIVQSNTF